MSSWRDARAVKSFRSNTSRIFLDFFSGTVSEAEDSAEEWSDSLLKIDGERLRVGERAESSSSIAL